VINIDGILFRLIDTAGIREHTSDLIETLGMEKSFKEMKEADVVLYIFDVNEATSHELRAAGSDMNEKGIKHLLVLNKIDLVDEREAKEKFSGIDNIIFISAKEHKHTEVLKEKLVDSVLQGQLQTESAIVTNARHYHALKEVEKSLNDIKEGFDKKLSGDLLSLDIRRCLHWLGEITGEVTNEDQLDYIFSKFCIGK
jgi:tRNA modification GTPase